jgi:hypothetical protein
MVQSTEQNGWQDVSEKFKQQVARWDASGIFDEIAAAVVKIVESNEDFRKSVTNKSRHQHKLATADIGAVAAA